ncbi:MAG: hypothetical protein LKJ25_00970 [Clostridia bacterium]|nr:hypothetical protein [Clostridia bacterium]
MKRIEKIRAETEKLREIFKNAAPETLNLIGGLVGETAFLQTELEDMRNVLNETGMIKVHPADPTKQKALPIANEYRRTLNVYSMNIKVLAAVLRHVDTDEEDEFDIWLKEKRKLNDGIQH